MLDRLGGAGLLDRTLVVVAGDHGESLGEHGESTHSMFVYDVAQRKITRHFDFPLDARSMGCLFAGDDGCLGLWDVSEMAAPRLMSMQTAHQGPQNLGRFALRGIVALHQQHQLPVRKDLP